MEEGIILEEGIIRPRNKLVVKRNYESYQSKLEEERDWKKGKKSRRRPIIQSMKLLLLFYKLLL